MVITDDQGYGDLSVYGNPILRTPHLDALHDDSVRLVDYHVAPTCAPTRSALQSGHYTNRTGVWHTIMGRSMLREEEMTLGQAFSDSGYATGMFGKWHLGDNYPFRPEDRGYTEVVRHGAGGVGQTPDLWDNAYFDDTYFHNGVPEKYEGFCTDVFFNEAKRFIEESEEAGKPWFAYISTNAPHGPFHCPDEYWKPYAEKYDIPTKVAIFYGMIANIDDNVGAMRKWLAEKGLSENTIFIFTTDNGTATGENVYNYGMKGKKNSEYEGGHRVPFFIHWPEFKLRRGRDVTEVTAAYDILPTLIEMCDLKQPENYTFDGMSIAPLIQRKKVDWPDRILFTDSQRVRDPIKWRKSAVMTNEWRLVNGKELYQIQRDRGQNHNVAEEYPEVFQRLRQAYEDWWAELEPTFAIDARIIVGNDAENPSTLTSHDWLTNDGTTPWNQSHIRGLDTNANGVWALRVDQAGEYEVRLRRWPDEGAVADVKIIEGIAKGAAVPGLKAFRETKGRAIPVKAARLTVGESVQEVPVAECCSESVFKIHLEKGDTYMRGEWILEDDSRMGTYYAYVKRL
jgi:arylsulfatase B